MERVVFLNSSSKLWQNLGAVRDCAGSVPPEDFANEFEFPLDLIKVTEEPVVSAAEAAKAIEIARSENVDINEYTSGKYRLGGDWLAKMDKTRAWFNDALEARIFPAIAASFPEVVTNVSTLRAHSVAMLKYNATHPRTDARRPCGVVGPPEARRRRGRGLDIPRRRRGRELDIPRRRGAAAAAGWIFRGDESWFDVDLTTVYDGVPTSALEAGGVREKVSRRIVRGPTAARL